MCPRNRSLLVAAIMLVTSLLVAALIADFASRGADPAHETAALRNSQPPFSETMEQGLHGRDLASMDMLR